MNKPVIKKAIIKDKIYFYDKDCMFDDIDNFALFSYGDDHFSILEHITDNMEDIDNNLYALPSNCLEYLDIKELIDDRNFPKYDTVSNPKIILRPEQKEGVDAFFNGDTLKSGLLHAECGWGKTFALSNLITRAKVKTLVIVHTKLLFNQWVEELNKQLVDEKIGKIGDGIFNLQPITVGIYKSVNNNIDSVKDNFGLVIVDEAHLCPAEVFSKTVNSINSKVKIAATATPRRRDGKHILLPYYFGSFVHIAEDSREKEIPYVEIIKTDIPFFITNPKRDWAKALTKLGQDSNYINLIADEVNTSVLNGRCVLVLSERIAMLQELNKKIPNSVLLIGSTKKEDRDRILSSVGGNIKVILTTKLFDEGISCHRLDTIILTCPTSNTIKLEQRIGRICREHPNKKYPKIIEFALKGPIVQAQLAARIRWYMWQRESPKKYAYKIIYR